MAFQSPSQTISSRPARGALAGGGVTGIRRVLHALAAAHRRRLRFDMARHAQASRRVRPELEYLLSWRFGVPVR